MPALLRWLTPAALLPHSSLLAARAPSRARQHRRRVEPFAWCVCSFRRCGLSVTFGTFCQLQLHALHLSSQSHLSLPPAARLQWPPRCLRTSSCPFYPRRRDLVPLSLLPSSSFRMDSSMLSSPSSSLMLLLGSLPASSCTPPTTGMVVHTDPPIAPWGASSSSLLTREGYQSWTG